MVGISSAILLGVFAILRVGSEQSQLSQTKMTLQDGAREALFKMTQEIRQSTSSRINVLANGNMLSLVVPDPAALVQEDYSVNWDGAHYILYSLSALNSPGQILRTDTTTNQTSVLANDITGLLFAKDPADPNVITITVSAQRALTSGRLVPANPLQLTAQAEARNL